MKSRLLSLISSQTATVGVLGLGYVGLPLAHAFSLAGFGVIGFDSDEAKLEAIRRRENYLPHLPPTVFAHLTSSDSFQASSDTSRLADCDVLLVAVPTPLGPHLEPDLSFVEAAGASIGVGLREGQLIVLESTTYPGTTRDVFLTAVREASPRSDLVSGEHYFVAYSPEREDPGRDLQTTSVPKIVGGLDGDAVEIAEAFYRAAFDQVIAVDSAEVAEAAKLLENIFRAVNIALVNEMKVVLQTMDIDIWQVIDAAATKPYGFMPFFPGPGLGGHCIPIDPLYMSWKAKEVGEHVEFIELAAKVNRTMPRFVVERLAEALNRSGKPVSKSKILVMGLAYKPGVGDTRESPSYELIRLLQARAGVISFHDEYAPETDVGRSIGLGLSSIDLTPEVVADFDAVLISTAQHGVPWEMLADHAQLVVDTRNVMAAFAEKMGERLVKA